MGVRELIPTFAEKFSEVVAQWGNRPAIEFDGSVWSYQDLDAAANQIAQRILAQKIPHQAVVGIELDKSANYVAALLGIWQCGCVALPSSPEMPATRRQELLRHSDAALSITESMVDWFGSGRGNESSSSGPASSSTTSTSSDAAYLIYTSGSTGVPKGVLISHAGLLPVLADQIDAFKLDETTRSLFYLSTAFDASLSDIGTVLLAGGTLVIRSDSRRWSVEELFRQIESLRISYCDLPPSLLTHAARLSIQVPSSLKTIVIGGEVCDYSAVEYWAKRVRLLNVYGPTEATICTSIHLCDPTDLETTSRSEVPIGRPIAAMRYCVADDGELWIGGPGLAIEYWKEPELTAAKFVVDEGHRWYRTGDRVDVGPLRELYFRGRMDRQFKCMGRLIEPAEIEHRLLESQRIVSAAIVPIANEDGIVNRFVAAIELADDIGSMQQEIESAYQRLRGLLPTWMLPNKIVALDPFPRTISGKPDLPRIRALSVVDLAKDPRGLSVVDLVKDPRAPVTPGGLTTSTTSQAELLRDVCEQALGRSVQWHDRFYEIGGDSLSAMTVMARMRSNDWTLSPDSLQHHTILECAKRLNQAGSMSSDEIQTVVNQTVAERIELQPCGSRNAGDGVRCLFMTGATGFLGTWLLEETMRRFTGTVICLVRAGSQELAMNRLRSSRRRYLGTTCESLPQQQIEVVCGDVSLPQFGFSETQWSQICDRATDVVHLAGDVHLLRSFDQMLGVNTMSVATAIEMCHCGNAKQLHDASTLSVFVASDRSDRSFCETDRLQTPCRIFGGYGQSKFAAERLIWSSEFAIEPSVLRLGLLTGDQNRAIGPDQDQLTQFTRGLVDLGMYPHELDDICFDATPVDQAAAIASQLILGSASGAWHVCSRVPVSLGRWVNAMRRHGVNIDGVDEQTFLRALQQQDRFDASKSLAALSLSRRLATTSHDDANHHQMDLFLATDVRFDCTRTERFLADAAMKLPFADDALLTKMVERMLRTNEVTR